MLEKCYSAERFFAYLLKDVSFCSEDDVCGFSKMRAAMAVAFQRSKKECAPFVTKKISMAFCYLLLENCLRKPLAAKHVNRKTLI